MRETKNPAGWRGVIESAVAALDYMQHPVWLALHVILCRRQLINGPADPPFVEFGFSGLDLATAQLAIKLRNGFEHQPDLLLV